MSRIDIKSMLTPELLDEVHKILYPLPKTTSLNAKELMENFVSPPNSDVIDRLYALCFDQVLKPLSQVSIDKIPDLMECLPPPEAANFPERALGAILTLDQVPRIILSGIDTRWVNGFFDSLARRLLAQLHALPTELRPDNIERWRSLGYSYDNIFDRRMIINVPLVHSEDIELHRQQMEETEALRCAVEKHYGVTDVSRSLDAEDKNDVIAFYRLIHFPPAFDEETGFHEYLFQWCRIRRVHEPIIRTFGRYPYRNAYFGRENTKEEDEFLKDTKYMATPKEETRKKLSEDITAGRWTPLQGRVTGTS